MHLRKQLINQSNNLINKVLKREDTPTEWHLSVTCSVFRK